MSFKKISSNKSFSPTWLISVQRSFFHSRMNQHIWNWSGKSHLSRGGHGVSLIKDNNFVGRAGFATEISNNIRIIIKKQRKKQTNKQISQQDSGNGGVMVSTSASPHNHPGSIPGSGITCAVWILVFYSYSSATSSLRDAKQKCRLCTHASKFMHRRKRTWMTKLKSWGPETDG